MSISKRTDGAITNLHFAIGECSLGLIVVAKNGQGICAILPGDDPTLLLHDLQDRFPHANLIAGGDGVEGFVAKVMDLIERPAVGLDLPLCLHGTAFQQSVWLALQQIPAGSIASYMDIANAIGMPNAVRAVAQACAANALAVAIPCHRVVRADGTLSGYHWGVERKRALLDREARA